MMSLIWTYNGDAVLNKINDSRRITLINYYILSITEAKNLGYHTIIYTNTNSIKYFEGLVDEIIELNNYHSSLQWDSFKVNVLETRDDDFCLIDGDLILKKVLPDLDEGIMFDTYELGNWKKEYENTINQFTQLGIRDLVKEWDDVFTPIINTGILRFKSRDFKDLYVQRWKMCDKWISQMNRKNKIDMDSASLVGGQYLLTIMANYHNINKMNINEQMGENGTFYMHYFGENKFLNPLVPTDYLLNPQKTKNLF